jgi:hypothetical protein
MKTEGLEGPRRKPYFFFDGRRRPEALKRFGWQTNPFFFSASTSSTVQKV